MFSLMNMFGISYKNSTKVVPRFFLKIFHLKLNKYKNAPNYPNPSTSSTQTPQINLSWRAATLKSRTLT